MKEIFLSERNTFFSSFAAALSAFFCFVSYELFRSSSESVFLSLYSATDKIYALAYVPLFLIFAILLYSYLLNKYGPHLTSLLCFVLSAFAMFIFYIGCKRGVSFFVFSVLVFKEAYIVILSELYWSYINSILTLKQARLLNGYIAGFGASGSIVGGYLVFKLAYFFSGEFLFILSAISLSIAAFVMHIAYRIKKPSFSSATSLISSVNTIRKNGVLKILFWSVFISQVISTFADLNFTEHLKSEITFKDSRTAYLGLFWTYVNIFSFTFQFLLTPILLKNISPTLILVFVPCIHILTSSYAFILPSLFSASIVFLLFKSIDYSLYRASKETLYIPFCDDVRFKAKQIIDAFNYRFAKGFVSFLLSFISYRGLNIFPFLTPSVVILSSIWAFMMNRIRNLVFGR
ncbi:MAG: hypothetical protein ACP5PA_04270 [Elusimicrobiales bacterium]